MRRLALLVCLCALALLIMLMLAPAAAAATAPPLRSDSTGQRVRDASYLLQGHNVFRLRTYTGPIVSVYGSALGQASTRAKWRLGYPAERVNGTFGATIRGYLLGLAKLPADYRQRRQLRLASVVTESYPLAKKGTLIGFPYVGTHAIAFNRAGGSDNWQSERAVDIATPVGTHALATGAGYICPGCGFGPFSIILGSRFAGNRLTLVVTDAHGRELDRFYYAHLTGYAPGIRPGVHVTVGQLLGYTGSANGVAHLHFAEEIGNPLTWVERTKPVVASSYGLLEWPNYLALGAAGAAILLAGRRRKGTRS